MSFNIMLLAFPQQLFLSSGEIFLKSFRFILMDSTIGGGDVAAGIGGVGTGAVGGGGALGTATAGGGGIDGPVNKYTSMNIFLVKLQRINPLFYLFLNRKIDSVLSANGKESSKLFTGGILFPSFLISKRL